MTWIRLLLMLALPGLCFAGPIYTLTDLGTLGGSSIIATGLNAQGQVAGSVTTLYGNMLAFSSSGLLTTSGTQSEAAAINDSGQIAGTQYFGNQTYATIWNSGVPTNVGGSGSFATAINSQGDVAGMLIHNGQGNAFVTENGSVIDLGTFAGGSWSAAYALNDAGQAAGYGMTENGNFRAFVWTPGQGYAILGTLGGASSYAMAVNNEGLIAGSAQTPGGYSHAFISNGVTMQDLGTLGGFASYAYGINDAGNIVGDSWTAGNASADGFLVEGGVMYDINALLIDDPGWTVTALYAINDSNQIVGVGLLNGVEHAVLLTDPPAPDSLTTTAAVSEPVEWVLTAAGLAMLVLRRRITPSASPPPPLQPRLPPGHRR